MVTEFQRVHIKPQRIIETVERERENKVKIDGGGDSGSGKKYAVQNGYRFCA